MKTPHHTNGAFESLANSRYTAYCLLIFVACVRVPAAEPVAPRAVSVYVENPPHATADLQLAKLITSQIFASIGVKVDWIATGNEYVAVHNGAIVIRFSLAARG